MDSIEITGIRAYGYTGYLPEERVLGQWFEVDLVLWLDLAPAGQSDNIEETLDYRQAISIVKQQIATAKFAVKFCCVLILLILLLISTFGLRIKLEMVANYGAELKKA